LARINSPNAGDQCDRRGRAGLVGIDIWVILIESDYKPSQTGKYFTVIEKIISGAQTGADRAALDAAIELGIPHGGWVPKGRLAEDGVIPQKYHLKEMPTESYAHRTEQNVVDSEGTLILAHGLLSGGSALTKEFAEKHKRPCLNIDLNIIPAFKAATLITTWIEMNHIRTLNVAGPRASNDPEIYRKTRDILESAFHIGMIKKVRPDLDRDRDSIKPDGPPKSVEEAVDLLVAKLPLKDKVTLANMTREELSGLDTSLGKYIRNNFKLWSRNSVLLETCRFFSDKDELTADDAASIIITALWEKLRKTHKLRVISE